MLSSLHHVQLAMPTGGEAQARAFYSALFGLPEVPKPPVLAARGGLWFEQGDIRVHLGVENPFEPAKKAHPAFVVADIDRLADMLLTAKMRVRWDSDLPDHRRFYTADPFGNRIEILG